MPRTIPWRPSRANLLLALTLALLSGCGDKRPTASVSGTVTYNGKPFEGTITFVPSGNSTERKDTSAPIRGGRYEMPIVSAGTKAVVVAAFKDEPASQPTPDRAKKMSKNPMPFWYPKPRSVELQPGSQTLDFTLSPTP